jgi:dolichyl-phosphate mannosyltransferase polypeptide 2 regulatory subunit
MLQKDQQVGLVMLLVATFIFAYYSLWTFATPFLAEDNIIQQFFPPRYYAIALPVIALILGICLVATFIGSVILKSASKKKAKKN